MTPVPFTTQEFKGVWQDVEYRLETFECPAGGPRRIENQRTTERPRTTS
jgi:hypothetical protein